ncbi:MAG: TonB-dependent receptor plug domain-containing protein [Gemmatimonadota bacterium]
MKTRLAFVLLLLSASLAAAQQTPDTIRLEPVVVTATRVATPLSRVTTAITVISGDELRRAGVRTVDEALRTVSGAMVVQTGSYGAGTSLFLRGGESDYVQVLIDGVQINSPGEQFNWSGLSIEDIERIEVVKGPASVLYGSDAVAGVVQLFTKQRRGKPSGQLSIAAGRGNKVGAQAAGTFDNISLRGELSGSTGTAAYSLGLSHFDTEGAYAFNNDHRSTSVTGSASLAVDRTQFDASARYALNRFHFPTDGSGQLADSNQYQDASILAVALSASRRFSPKLDLDARVTHSQNQDTTDDQPDDAADTLGFFSFNSAQRFSRQNVDLRLNYRLNELSTLTVGSEFEWQASRGSYSSPFGASPETTDQRSNRAAYAQLLADFSRVSVQLGARGEDNQKFGNVATYRGGIAARVSSSVRLRASAGTGFKEPRFFEQFAQGFVRGNPELEPERSRSLEGALDVTVGRVTLTSSYFDQKFTNLIQYVAVTADPNAPNYMNVAGARASGLELSAAVHSGRIAATGSYTLLDTEVTDEGAGNDASFQKGEQLLRRPRHSASAGVRADLGQNTLGVSVHYAGERADLDFSSFPANRVTLPAYTRVDVSAQRPLLRSVSVSLKIENALNEDYQEVLNFPARGRVVLLGATLAF